MKSEIQQLRRLWADTFGDSDGYLDIFFDTYSRSALILTEERSGCIISALWGLPFRFSGGLKGLYLCGLATLPQWRGYGIMSRLMMQAEEWAVRNNFDFIFLIPADDDLRKYYSKRGFINSLQRKIWKLPVGASCIETTKCEVEDLRTLEKAEATQNSTRPLMIHECKDWEAVLRESDISGGKIFCSQKCNSRGNRKIEAVAFAEASAEAADGSDGSDGTNTSGNSDASGCLPLRIVKVLGSGDGVQRLLDRIGAKEATDCPYGMWKPLSQSAKEAESPDFFLLLD